MAAVRFLTRHAAAVAALALLAVLYGFARPPRLSDEERERLAGRFAFRKVELPSFAQPEHRFSRQVHPDVAHISAWMSAVGAGVALGDIDGDGRPNDLCLVDPRVDLARVLPAPGSGDRFEEFAVDPYPLPYSRRTMAPMGCLLPDLNEDGRTDLLVYYWGRSPVAFLRLDDPAQGTAPALGMGRFRPVEVAAGAPIWNTNALVTADVDGDGHLDLVVGNYFPDDARILDPQATDEWPMQDSMSKAFNAGRNRILRWTAAAAGADPTVEFAEAEGVFSDEVAGGWTLAAGAADLDGDLLPELYFANDFGPDRMLHNRSRPGRIELAVVEGKRGFLTPKSKVVGQDSFKGMGVDFGDLDGDGRLDLMVSNIAHAYALQESHFAFFATGEPGAFARGRAPFVDRSEALGLARSFFAWEARLGDFDNDGVLEALQATGFVKGAVDRWPELQELATGNDQNLKHPQAWPRFMPGDDLSGDAHPPFFVRAADGRYYDLAPEVGLGEPMVSRGIATADVDRDGDLDFAVANQWERSFLVLNEGARSGRFLGLRLLLPPAAEGSGQTRVAAAGERVRGRPAIGATVRVRLVDGRVSVAQVDGGNGHSGKRAPELHFGLGAVDPARPLAVELAWRDRRGELRRQTLALAPGWHTVVLGEGS